MNAMNAGGIIEEFLEEEEIEEKQERIPEVKTIIS